MAAADARVVRAIAARTHGRYLVAQPAGGRPAPMLVGFHGYGEDADAWLAQAWRIPAAREWLVVSVQALHRFYNTKTEATVGSWMTSLDRDLLIADNVDYVRAVVDDVRRNWPVTAGLVYAGFSQGVAMAYRAAALGGHACQAVLALGGDVPPEILRDPSAALPPALIGCGTRDEWYAPAKLDADASHLRARGVEVETVVFDGGHEWGQPYLDACERWLHGLRARTRA